MNPDLSAEMVSAGNCSEGLLVRNAACAGEGIEWFLQSSVISREKKIKWAVT